MFVCDYFLFYYRFIIATSPHEKFAPNYVTYLFQVGPLSWRKQKSSASLVETNRSLANVEEEESLSLVSHMSLWGRGRGKEKERRRKRGGEDVESQPNLVQNRVCALTTRATTYLEIRANNNVPSWAVLVVKKLLDVLGLRCEGRGVWGEEV